MCGIAGFTGKKNQALLSRMTDLLAYRGPDEQGFFNDQGINFGHRRLSIIDLKSGQQPMHDASGDISLIYNGEIYNFQELRQKYLSDYPLATTSDTEVIIYLYKEKGEDFL